MNVNVLSTYLVESFLSLSVLNPKRFVSNISGEDEMYLFSFQNTPKKETTSYLYLNAGQECFYSIENVIRCAGKEMKTVRSFLDFAAGYGRVTRFLITEINPERIWASDIYRGAVDFLKGTFGVNGFYSETEPQDLTFPGRFEIIYAGSLFSHLPEHRSKAWLKKLYDALEDDGILIFSVQGDSLRPEGMKEITPGFAYLEGSESRSLSSKEYGAAFVTPEWVKAVARELGMAHIYCHPQELCGYQDLCVATKRLFPSLEKMKQSNYPQGMIEEARLTENMLRVSGWAREKDAGAPIKAVRIYAEDILLGEATIGLDRPDVAKFYRKDNCLKSGWEFRGEIPHSPTPLIKAAMIGHTGQTRYQFLFASGPDYQAMLNERDARIGRLEAEREGLEAKLNSIYNSNGWRALLKYYRLRDKVLSLVGRK